MELLFALRDPCLHGDKLCRSRDLYRLTSPLIYDPALSQPRGWYTASPGLNLLIRAAGMSAALVFFSIASRSVAIGFFLAIDHRVNLKRKPLLPRLYLFRFAFVQLIVVLLGEHIDLRVLAESFA